jgi:hypothetical protein
MPLCPSRLPKIIVALNPKLVYVRREGTTKEQAFPGVSRPRKLNAFKGIPLWPVFGSPIWGDGHGGGTVRFL